MIRVIFRNSITGVELERFMPNDAAFARWFKWVNSVMDENSHISILVEDA